MQIELLKSKNQVLELEALSTNQKIQLGTLTSRVDTQANRIKELEAAQAAKPAVSAAVYISRIQDLSSKLKKAEKNPKVDTKRPFA